MSADEEGQDLTGHSQDETGQPAGDVTLPEIAASGETETVSASLLGTRIGDYQVMRKLGRGGMADVYAARQLSLGRDVALKVLRSNFARDKDYVARFRREARAAAKLNHPNIVQVYEVGSVDTLHFIAQELIDGENLKQSLDRGGAISAEEAVEVLVGVGSALECAADAGITHRDIKPENVMRSRRGLIKVADFGLARLSADVSNSQASLTQAGLTLGTPRYMSPEQVQGKSVDVRSDLYSLGVTLYHLLAGRPPFEADDPLALALMHLQETPTPLDRARDRATVEGEPDLPEWLIAVVTRLMSKLPQERFQSPTEMLDAVKNEAATSNLSGFETGTAAATIRLQRATDRARRLRTGKNLRLLAACLIPIAITGLTFGLAMSRSLETVGEMLDPDKVIAEGSVEEQYLAAVARNDEASWLAVSEYFPASENSTNASYHAKATLQLANFLSSEGRLVEADRTLSALIREANIDDVYLAVALARRCNVLDQLNQPARRADARRQLLSIYQGLSEEKKVMVERSVPRQEFVQLGLNDS